MDKILSILGSVGFNWHVALANFINFLIILFILNKFFFGSLRKTIENRKLIIDRGLAQASDAEKALTEAEEKKKGIIHEAKKEGHVILQEAEVQAEALALAIKTEAEREITTRMEDLKEKEAHLLSKVEKEFNEKAPHIVAKLYAETLRKNLTEKENNELIVGMK